MVSSHAKNNLSRGWVGGGRSLSPMPSTKTRHISARKTPLETCSKSGVVVTDLFFILGEIFLHGLGFGLLFGRRGWRWGRDFLFLVHTAQVHAQEHAESCHDAGVLEFPEVG